MDLERRMARSPEGDLMKKERGMSLDELAERSDRMALNIVASEAFLRDVKQNLHRLILGTEKEKESLGAEIAARHPEAIPEVVEDERDQAALVVQVARRIENISPTIH